MEKFYIGDYIKEEKESVEMDFKDICSLIYSEFLHEWNDENRNYEKLLDIQKKAIIGMAPEVDFFKQKIKQILIQHELQNSAFPEWYENLEEGIFHENWGLSVIAEWFSGKYRESSSAKVIGDRVYFMEKGRMTLMPQKICSERREQLIRSFLMLTPDERLDKDFHEIYLIDGTRITIFRRNMVKDGQDVIIFRRYIVPSYSFEEQAARGTIPDNSLPLLKSMAGLGFNVAFTGAVRTAKTTFLSTWQMYEDSELEGVMIETDPEIPMHKLMPEAPVVQLLADGDRLSAITKNLLRSDADYFIMAEARDGIALDTVIRAAAKGTRRMKITFHTRNPLDFPYDVAGEIVNSLGGDLEYTAKRAAASFDYIFHFIQLSDKSKKRLNSIYEMTFERETGKIIFNEICVYNHRSDSWKWSYHISEEKKKCAAIENEELFNVFENELRKLSCLEGAET